MPNQGEKIISSVVKVLYRQHAEKTIIGILLGIVLSAMPHVLPTWPQQISLFQYLAAGILVIHLPVILFHFFRPHKGLPEGIQTALDTIERQEKRGGISSEEAIKLRREILVRVVSNVTVVQGDIETGTE